MCCQLDGYRQDQLAFVDELLKELGEKSGLLKKRLKTPFLITYLGRYFFLETLFQHFLQGV